MSIWFGCCESPRAHAVCPDLCCCFLPVRVDGRDPRRLGLGELPYTPLMSYLTRTLPAMYASMGAVLLFISFDVDRYRPLIRLVGVLAVAGGVGVAILDAAAGLPLFWTVSEGPLTVALGGALSPSRVRVPQFFPESK